MKKFIFGFMCAALIFSAGAVAADSVSYIGKTIKSEAVVTLDGEEIGKALIVDGVSHPPLRVLAEALGLNAGYEKGVVKLETQTTEKRSAAYWESRIENLNKYLESTKTLVSNTENAIVTSNEIIAGWEYKFNNLADGTSDKVKETYASTILDLNASHQELVIQLSEYQAKVAEIEADIALAKAELTEAQAQ